MFFDKLKISNLNVKLEEANANVEHLKAELLRVKHNEDISKATASIDFDKIKCFSIERTMSRGVPCTTLGYNLFTDTENTGPREWSLLCSYEQHENLVEIFNKQKGK
jgi:predicted RNase H-like nuclease (RuvC/YqgF family)